MRQVARRRKWLMGNRTGVIVVQTSISRSLFEDADPDIVLWRNMRMKEHFEEALSIRLLEHRKHHRLGSAVGVQPARSLYPDDQPRYFDVSPAVVGVAQLYVIGLTTPGKAKVGDLVLDSAFPNVTPEAERLVYAGGRKFMRGWRGGWLCIK